MKVVVAPDSFKGTLTAQKVGALLARTVSTVFKSADVKVLPLADGGEGSVGALELAGWSMMNRLVNDLFSRPKQVVLAKNGGTIFVEAAQSVGIAGVPQASLDPLGTTSFGVGQMIKAAVDSGANEVVVGLGGTASLDGGMGMVCALGGRVIDNQGSVLTGCGASMELARRAWLDTRSQLQKKSRFVVAVDVTAPLLGPHGAARLFGPQKGASPRVVERLEAGMTNWQQVLSESGMPVLPEQPGDGAAGGMGMACRTFLGARLVSGADFICDQLGLEKALWGADLLITGEGCTDGSTFLGKLPFRVGQMARARGVPALLISGALRGSVKRSPHPFVKMWGTTSGAVPDAKEAENRLVKTATSALLWWAKQEGHR